MFDTIIREQRLSADVGGGVRFAFGRGKNWRGETNRHNDATSDSSHILHITSFPNFPCKIAAHTLVIAMIAGYCGGGNGDGAAFFSIFLCSRRVAHSSSRFWFHFVVIFLKAQTISISIALIHLVSGSTHIGISQIS